PGFNREFASDNWTFIKSLYWKNEFEEVEDLANYDQDLDINGSDIDHNMIKIANQNANEAGFAYLLSWKQMQVKDLHLSKERGYIIGNPPYGERIGDRKAKAKINQDLGRIMFNHLT